MKQSTSIHSLNADKGLGPAEKILYLFLNFINNLLPYINVDKRIQIRNYAGAWREYLGQTHASSSIGRRLSDLFWRSLPWESIKEELGEIHVFDTGCGQGNYSLRLWEGIKSYTGVDQKKRENWETLEKEHHNFRFVQSSSTSISPLIPPEANLFITQSATEHFDEDLKFFEEINAFVQETDKPVIQIHNMPAKAVLPLYLFHGVRQYTPRTLSKVTRLFKDSKFYLYGLGGEAGKKVQWRHFTWPHLILRREATWSRDVEKYNAEVIKAIEQDTAHPSKSPIFWVLIIHSHPRRKIW